MIINFRHLLGATRYSLAGLRRCWAEQAFRHEVLVLVCIPPLLAVIRPGFGWSAALVAAWLGVMAVELLNTAVEEVCDLVSPDYNRHVQYAKDMASAAIFVSIVANGVLWAFMLCGRYVA